MIHDLPRAEVVTDLKAILAMAGVINSNKGILFDALTLFIDKNVDFVDALICTKSKLQGYEWLSFDRNVNKNCN